MKILNKLSFHKKIFLACLLTALVPLLCSSVVMIRLFTAALDRQNLDEGRTQITKAEARLEAVFEKCEEACKTIATDKKTARIMIEKSEADHQREMYLSLYQATQETSGYARFSIYDSGGRLCYTTDTEGKEKDLPVFWGLLRKASRTDDIVYYRTDPDLSITDGDILLQGARPLYTEGGAKTGYIVFDFTRENLDDLLGAEVSSGDVLLLLDTHKRTVYCSGQDKSQVQTGDMIEKILENRKMSDAGHDREQYLVSHGGKTGFYFLLCRQAPMSQPAVQTMWTVSLCLSALGLFLCLAVSGVLTGSIARPVQTLDEAMEKVKKGDLSIRIHTQSNDEMGRLTRSFNQMTEDLGRYLEDKVQRQKDLNETTLKLYQTQLNPHFLYNTLDTIKWEARIRQVPRIAVLAENLAIIYLQGGRRVRAAHPAAEPRFELCLRQSAQGPRPRAAAHPLPGTRRPRLSRGQKQIENVHGSELPCTFFFTCGCGVSAHLRSSGKVRKSPVSVTSENPAPDGAGFCVFCCLLRQSGQRRHSIASEMRP